MSDKLAGRLYGKNLTQLNFICDAYNEDGSPSEIELGQMLMAEDGRTGNNHLIRVTDLEYGQPEDYNRLVARELHQLNNADFSVEHAEPGNIYEPDEKEDEYFQAICEHLGIIQKDGAFTSAKRLPSFYSPVSKVSEANFGSLSNKVGDLPIGKLRSGSDILDIDAGLHKELLPYHIGVFAQTGGGKSNTMLVLLGSILETGGEAASLIFDPHGEYIEEMKKHPLANTQLIRFAQEAKSTDANVRKIRVGYGDVRVNDLMNVREQLNWTDAQIRFLREAEHAYPDWFRIILNTPLDGTEMEEMMEKASSSASPFGFMDDGYGKTLLSLFPDYKEDTLRAIRSKLRQVQNAPFLVEDDSASNIDEIMSLLEQGKSVLIDMASLSGLYELLLSTILSTKVLEKRRYSYTKDREHLKKNAPSINIVMEEAQRVLGKTSSQGNVFAQICNEGRKFKVGLVAITQQPKLMNEILISQFNTLIILSISDSKDFDVLNGLSKKPIDKLKQEIKSLMPGQAIVTSPKSPFAVPIQVHLYDNYVELAAKRNKAEKPKISSAKLKGFV